MATPESKVKLRVKKILDAFNVYYYMPVPMAYSATGVDFHCVVRVAYLLDDGWAQLPIGFFIETKKLGGVATARQEEFLKRRREDQNCKTFVIDGDDGYHELELWLRKLQGEDSSNERLYATGGIHGRI